MLTVKLSNSIIHLAGERLNVAHSNGVYMMFYHKFSGLIICIMFTKLFHVDFYSITRIVGDFLIYFLATQLYLLPIKTLIDNMQCTTVVANKIELDYNL